jgi:hypothetical protein
LLRLFCIAVLGRRDLGRSCHCKQPLPGKPCVSADTCSNNRRTLVEYFSTIDQAPTRTTFSMARTQVDDIKNSLPWPVTWTVQYATCEYILLCAHWGRCLKKPWVYGCVDTYVFFFCLCVHSLPLSTYAKLSPVACIAYARNRYLTSSTSKYVPIDQIFSPTPCSISWITS